MLIMIAYATIEGQTRTIAERMAAEVELAGHKVMLADLSQPGFALPGDLDAIILAAPIHGGRYPPQMVRFIKDWKAELEAVPSALVTVSLAIASQNSEERAEATAYPDKLQSEAGWIPAHLHHAAGALKYLEYDFFKRYMLRRIAEAEGGPVDTWRDHELTDWAALAGFVHAFLAQAGGEVQ